MNVQTENSRSDVPTAGALAFLRGEKGADIAEIHSRLLREDGVAASVPLSGGEWNILLRLAAKDMESLDQIAERLIGAVKGVEDIEARYLEEIWTADTSCAEYKASACAVLDVDSGSLSALVARFREMTEVTEGNITDDGKKIILFLRDNSFREIRNIVGREIRPLSGVLRVKLFNAMNF